MPQDLFDKLEDKLKELRMTDNALQASMTHEEGREKLESKGIIIRLDKLLEMSQEEIIEYFKKLGFNPPVRGSEFKIEDLVEDLSNWWESEDHEDDPADWWKSSSRSSADWWKDDIKDKE
jgi:hypothetical protein